MCKREASKQTIKWCSEKQGCIWIEGVCLKQGISNPGVERFMKKGVTKKVKKKNFRHTCRCQVNLAFGDDWWPWGGQSLWSGVGKGLTAVGWVSMGHEDTSILVGPVNLRGLAVMTRIVGFVFAAKKNTIQNKPRSWKLLCKWNRVSSLLSC